MIKRRYSHNAHALSGAPLRGVPGRAAQMSRRLVRLLSGAEQVRCFAPAAFSRHRR